MIIIHNNMKDKNVQYGFWKIWKEELDLVFYSVDDFNEIDD